MRNYLILALIAFLFGCTQAQVSNSLNAAAVASNQTAFGTLAIGPVEAAAAASYTKLAMIRHNAAKQLTEKEISIARAESILACTDNWRTQLDYAVNTENVAVIGLIGSQISCETGVNDEA